MFVSQVIDEAMEALGTTDKSKVYRKLSQAVKTLMQSGHYFHTISEIDVCSGWDKQTVTLPRGIEVPLAVNVDGSPTYFRNRLFQYHVNKGGMYNPVSWAWDDRGMVATQMDIRQPSQLVAVAEHEADAGKMIRVVGVDGNNRELRAQTDAGEGVDGMFVRIHALSDFPVGSIQPDGIKIETRNASVSPLNTFVSPAAHQLSSGEGAILNLDSGTLPPELEDGTKYWVGCPSSTEVQLYTNELDAKAQNEPIRVSSISGSPSLTLTDARPSALYTGLTLVDGTPQVPISVANEATFGPINGNTLPSQLSEDKTYFVNQQELNVLQVYETLVDARNEINPVLLTGQNSIFNAYLRSPINPETKLTFTSPHGYQSGDTVQAITNGGTLPQPLIASTNYYVHVVDSTTEYAVTLHLSYSDAITGQDPINLITAGVGQNAIAKLLQATANPGAKNNINVSGLNLPSATGSGAVVEAETTGSVTSAKLSNGGGGYSSATATISDAGGYKYTKSPIVTFVGGTTPSTQATATANIDFDKATGYGYVKSVSMTNNGSGYDIANPPSVVFSGGFSEGGFSAVGEAVVSRGVSLGAIGGSLLASGGKFWSTGNIVLFKDSSGTGDGAFGVVSALDPVPANGNAVTEMNVTKSGSNYTNPQFAGILCDPIWLAWIDFGNSGTPFTSLNITTLSGNVVEILNGTTVPWHTDWSTTTADLVAAINSHTSSTLYWAEEFTGGMGACMRPCVKLTVSSKGNTGDKITNLYLKYLNNGGDINLQIAAPSETPFNILPSSGVTVTSGMSTTAALATEIASKINSYTATSGVTAIASGSDVIIKPGYYVQSFYGTTTGLIQASYATSDYPISISWNSELDGKIESRITPVVPSVPFTGVVSDVKLLPVGSGADVSISVNTVSNVVNGISIVSTGSGYKYPPRLEISEPSNKYPSVQCTSSGVSDGTMTAFNVVQSNGTSLNLFAASQKVSSPSSPSNVATQIVNLINNNNSATHYSASISASSSDTVIISPPSGISISSISTTVTGSPSITLAQIIPSQAFGSISATTSFVTSYKVISSGKGYTTAPAVNVNGGGGTGASAVAVIDRNGIGSIAVLNGGSGYPSGIVGKIVDPNGAIIEVVSVGSNIGTMTDLTSIQSNGISVNIFGASSASNPVSQSDLANKIEAAINANTSSTGYSAIVSSLDNKRVLIFAPDGISVTDLTWATTGTPQMNLSKSFFEGTGSGATANVVVQAGVIQSINVALGGQGYSDNAQIVFIDPTSSSGWPTLPASVSFQKTGVVTNVNVVAEGTGYTSVPTVTIEPSTGVFVQFSSTGTLPSPIIQGQTYRAENPSSENTFTLKNNDFSDVNITSTGSGTIYLVLSRSFAIGFTGNWSGNFSGISISEIKLQTDYQLPVTDPATDTESSYYISKVSDSRAIIYTSYQNSSLSGKIVPTQLGIGQAYYAIPTRATVSVIDNKVLPSSSTYLSDGMVVQFSSSSGTLPSPLVALTDYKIYISGNFVTIKTMLGVDVVFTSLGNSQLSMNIIREFTPRPSSTVEISNCILETGDEISVRSMPGDSLPSPLQGSLTYFASRQGASLVKVCLTKEDALAGIPILLYSIGNSINSVFIVDAIKAPTLVKSILHIEKPLTLGYVSLYAFDYGRSNDMALIGQYHPSEINPKYRRIRIGKPCSWVRMAYRVRPVEVSSDADYIPIENERAVLTALHAIDLEDKDFLEQAQKYWQTAFAYLRSETESMDGHAMVTPQINNLTYGDGSDPVMF